VYSCKSLDDFHPMAPPRVGATTSTLAGGVAWHTACDTLATHGLAAFLAPSADDSPPPGLPLCTPGERGSLAASVPLKRASDRLLFLSLRSSFARWPSSLTTILTFIVAYSARSGFQWQLVWCGGRCALRGRSECVSKQLQPRQSGVALSVLCVSVSSVAVVCDAVAVHVLEICIDLAPRTFSTRIGHGL